MQRHAFTKVIGQCHVATGLWRFASSSLPRPCDTIEAQVPADLDVHLIVDNYATHKTALIRNCSGRWSIRSSAEIL